MKKKERREATMDVSSFSDIANLLIIFFILTTSLAHPFGKLLQMPSAATPEDNSQKAPKIPTINLMADRIVYTEGEGAEREITPNELHAELLGKNLHSKPQNDRLVMLEVAEEVAYQRYYEVVTMVSEAGGVVAMIGD
ncbi:MAG: biopolymer transporter ExbD [Kiritimatiellae bacterium]|nr:biopolymer transporter ExbD [Kiritimatiellia bacterium]